MAYLPGNAGFVTVGGVRLDVTSWTGTENGEHSETTNTGDGGFKSSILVKKFFSGTIEADFDAALGPKAAPTIEAGTDIALVLNTDTSGAYTIATAKVLTLNWTQPAGDKISYSFDFESSGVYSYA